VDRVETDHNENVSSSGCHSGRQLSLEQLDIIPGYIYYILFSRPCFGL
jgi:hypothetical protein